MAGGGRSDEGADDVEVDEDDPRLWEWAGQRCPSCSIRAASCEMSSRIQHNTHTRHTIQEAEGRGGERTLGQQMEQHDLGHAPRALLELHCTHRVGCFRFTPDGHRPNKQSKTKVCEAAE